MELKFAVRSLFFVRLIIFDCFLPRWRRLSSRIDAECHHMDKFVAGQGGIGHNWSGRRFIVTESWILVSRFTSFTVIKQSSEGMVAILASSISVLDPDSLTEGGRPAGENLGTQMVVAVRFVDVNTGVCLLTCRYVLLPTCVHSPYPWSNLLLLCFSVWFRWFELLGCQKAEIKFRKITRKWETVRWIW